VKPVSSASVFFLCAGDKYQVIHYCLKSISSSQTAFILVNLQNTQKSTMKVLAILSAISFAAFVVPGLAMDLDTENKGQDVGLQVRTKSSHNFLATFTQYG
jgi:3-hydroxymyristoyl/3-hydroxydecanoyl-(acyl carrier protein) dehydratase